MQLSSIIIFKNDTRSKITLNVPENHNHVEILSKVYNIGDEKVQFKNDDFPLFVRNAVQSYNVFAIVLK